MSKGFNAYLRGLQAEDRIADFLKERDITFERNKDLFGKYFKKNVDFFLPDSNTIIESKFFKGGSCSNMVYAMCAQIAMNFLKHRTIFVVGPIESEIKNSGQKNQLVWHPTFIYDSDKVFSFVVSWEKLDDWLGDCLNGFKPKDYDFYWENYYKKGTTTARKVVKKKILKYLERVGETSFITMSEELPFSKEYLRDRIWELEKGKKIMRVKRRRPHKKSTWYALYNKNKKLRSKKEIVAFLEGRKKPVKVVELRKFFVNYPNVLVRELRELERDGQIVSPAQGFYAKNDFEAEVVRLLEDNPLPLSRIEKHFGFKSPGSKNFRKFFKNIEKKYPIRKITGRTRNAVDYYLPNKQTKIL